MSVRNILTSGGVISSEYLPTGPAPAHPYVENPFQDDVDGGQQELTNLRTFEVGSTTAPNFRVDVPGPSTGAVFVNCDATPGYGLAVAPNTQTTGHGGISLSNGTASIAPTEYMIYNPSTTGGGLTAGHLQIFGFATGQKRILDAVAAGNSIVLGDDTIVGGCLTLIAGASGPGRVYDQTYNPTITIIPVASGTASNITTVTALPNTPEGTYQVQVYAESIVPAAGTRLNVGAYGPPPSTAILPFSTAGLLDTGASTDALGLNSGFFAWGGGTLTVDVTSSGANWTASVWSVQLVRFG